MEQITRDEMSELLAVAICPANCYNGVIAQNEQHGEIEQCRFCYEREQAITALQAAEPVATLKVREGWGKTPTSTLYDLVDLDIGDYQLFALPCPPAKADYKALEGHEVSIDVSTCDEDAGHRVFATITGYQENGDSAILLAEKHGANFDRPAKAQVPPFLSSKGGEHWPRTGDKYLVKINGVLQEEIFEFDQGDDGFGGGEYFWSRDDADECPPFNPETDKWLPLSALITSATAKAQVPEGWALLPKELTAENGAKALLLGEFYSEIVQECPDCCGRVGPECCGSPEPRVPDDVLQLVDKARQYAAALQAAEPVAYISHASEGDILGWERQFDAPSHTPLYATPQPAKAQVPEGWDAQAYATMRDEIEYWKRKAAESDEALERIANDMAPTHMGEPVINVSRDHQADAWLSVVELLNELSPGWITQVGLSAKEAALKTIRELTASPAPEHSEQDIESLMSQHRIGLIPINTTDWKAFVYDETIGQDHTCIASSPKAALTTLFASLGPIQQEEAER